MSNSSQTLKKGYSRPLVWIHNKLGEEVLIEDAYDSNINRPLSEYVESFKYKYDEENDDECTISCGFQKNSQLDNDIFNEDVVLKLQWGYIEVDGEVIKSPTRMVAIRDIQTSYTASGIKLTLQCTDLVAYLSRIRNTTKSSSNNFMDWLKELANGEFKATVRIGNDVMAIEKDEERGFSVDDNGTLFAMDNARAFKKSFIDLPDLFRMGSSKSIKAEILERLNTSTEGPAYLDGRDNSINIVVRNFNQKPWVAYTVGGAFDEVISFRAKSNMAKVKEDESETSTVNPKTKTVETTNANTASPNPDKGEYTQESLDGVYKALEEVWEHNIMNPTNMKPVPAIISKSSQRTGPWASDSNDYGNTGVWTGLTQKDLKVTVPTKTIINSPGFKSLAKDTIAKNYMLRKIERKFEASMSVIGDPSLITSKIYQFLGLSKRDSGNWYATVVEHDFSLSRGYICNITALKRPQALGIQYLKKKTKVMFEGGEIKTETKKENTEEKKYEKPKAKPNRTWDEVKKKMLSTDGSILSGIVSTDQISRLSIINAEQVAINSTPDLNQEVDITNKGIKPNIENV